MQQHKRRPTLGELKEMPVGLLRMEIAQLCVDAGLADNGDVLAEAEMLAMDPDPQPEKIVELWNLLREFAEEHDRELKLKASYKEGEL
jgi:hypothetical protein